MHYVRMISKLFGFSTFIVISYSLVCSSYLNKTITTELNSTTAKDNISELLDGLLEGYDHHVRPDLGGPPTQVYIDIEVRSMGPVSEVDMTLSMDCYFRQSWVDRRLEFTGVMPTLALSISMLERIWRPDTYFYNGKHSYLHTITSPNKFVRLHQDGQVLYSSRLTVKASCPMNLRKFPMDEQRCPLYIGSFGYSTSDVVYQWNPRRSVVIASDMKMSQFDLISTPSGNKTKVRGKEGPFSVLIVSFHLQRHMGYFLIEVYAPCTMLVVLSWVSFWINREATADRVALGITTLLTMTFLGLESRNDLPKVSYCTALDAFVAISFVFIFSVIIEFAAVHYFTKVGSGEFYFPPLTSSEESCSEDWDTEDNAADEMTNKDDETIPFIDKHKECSTNNQLQKMEEEKQLRSSKEDAHNHRTNDIHNNHVIIQPPATPTNTFKGKRHSLFRKRIKKPKKPMGEMQLNSVSRIDKTSRIVFPAVFVAMNFIYWYTYMDADR